MSHGSVLNQQGGRIASGLAEHGRHCSGIVRMMLLVLIFYFWPGRRSGPVPHVMRAATPSSG
jgi:hypothetical protein